VAVIATIFTAGAAAMMLGAAAGATSTFAAGMAALAGGSFAGVTLTAGVMGSVAAASVASAAIGAAVGSIASQAIGIAAGVQGRFSWKSVAISSLSAGVTAGVGASGVLAGNANAVIGRGVLANMATQGIAIGTGLQRRFDWRGVAASAVGAGVGDAVAPAFGDLFGAGSFGQRLGAGLVAGAAASLARGGRVVVQQVAVDAFGNALGSSLTSAASGVDDPTSSSYMNEMDRQSDAVYYARQQVELYRTGGDFARMDGKGYRSMPVEVPTPALVNEMTFSEDAALRRWTGDPYGLRNAANIAPQVSGPTTLDLGQAHDQWAATDRKPVYDFGDPFQVDGDGPLAQNLVRVVRGTGVRPVTVNGISVNSRVEALLNAAAEGDVTGMGNLYRDYKLLGALMNEGMQDNTLKDLRKQLQERLGVMRSLPSEEALGARSGIGADGVVRYDKADLIDRYSDALRKVGLAQQGVIELDYKNLEIKAIGNARFTPAQYLAEAETRYQRAFARGVELGEQGYARGELRYPGDMPKQLQVGLFADNIAREALVRYNQALGVPEGPGQIISLNRWAYDPQGTGLFVRPDVLIDFGPNQRYWIDGKTSLLEGQSSAKQFEIFYRYTNAIGGKVATPQGLFNIMPGGKVRR